MDLILLPGDCHLGNVFLRLFVDTLHAKEGLVDIDLEESVYLFVDFFDVFDTEAKNVPSRELACFEHESRPVFTFLHAHTLQLDPGQTHIEILAQLCKPDDADVRDDERSQVALLRRQVPDAVVFREDLLIRQHDQLLLLDNCASEFEVSVKLRGFI